MHIVTLIQDFPEEDLIFHKSDPPTRFVRLG